MVSCRQTRGIITVAIWGGIPHACNVTVVVSGYRYRDGFSHNCLTKAVSMAVLGKDRVDTVRFSEEVAGVVSIGKGRSIADPARSPL